MTAEHNLLPLAAMTLLAPLAQLCAVGLLGVPEVALRARARIHHQQRSRRGARLVHQHRLQVVALLLLLLLLLLLTVVMLTAVVMMRARSLVLVLGHHAAGPRAGAAKAA